jgi:hypothetical protein
LDKELVKLAEKHAREREEREKLDRERREREAKEAPKTQIQVKPIIETTTTTTTTTAKSRNSYVKTTNGDHDPNAADDLLRYPSPKKNKPKFELFIYFYLDLHHLPINSHLEHRLE